ncbi:MAG: Stp1/IreP family PP2C-type Ser/Thr phosphatase [Acidimicrobiales bacterium]
MTVLRAGVATDIGRARDSNEDRASTRSNLFAVADGMGGHVGGEVAARIAIETLQTGFEQNPTTAGLRQAFVAANSAIFEEGIRVDELRGMGTTLTAAGLTVGADGRDMMCLAHVGDSRAYLMSRGELRQLTSDHSLAEERFRHGEMTEAEAQVHPQRHILTRALGVGPGVDVDLWELHVSSGDRLLLCSDGLSNEVSLEQMTQVLASVRDPRKAARALVDRANAHGGSDNVTVVVVDVLVGEEGISGQPVFSKVLPASPSMSPPPAVPQEPPASGPAPSTDGGLNPMAPVLAAGKPKGASPDVTGVVRAAAVQTLVRAERPAPAPPTLPAPKESRRARRLRLGAPRRITARVVLFLLLVLAVPAGAIAVVHWYAMDNFYVAIHQAHLAIYQGRQGGFAGFEPKLVTVSPVSTQEVMAFRLPALRSTLDEPSLEASRQYIANLHEEWVSDHALGSPVGP